MAVAEPYVRAEQWRDPWTCSAARYLQTYVAGQRA